MYFYFVVISQFCLILYPISYYSYMQEARGVNTIALVAQVNDQISSIIEKNFRLNKECDGLKADLEEIRMAKHNLREAVVAIRVENKKLRVENKKLQDRLESHMGMLQMENIRQGVKEVLVHQDN